MEEEKSVPSPKAREIEVLVVSREPHLVEWVRAGLEGIPHQATSLEELPPASGHDQGPAAPDVPPDLALVDEDERADFPARLAEFKRRHARCQILLIGREDSALSPRQLGSAAIRHWFFRPVEGESIVRTVQAAGRSISRAWRERQRHSRSLTGFEAFWGKHPLFLETLDLARKVAASPTTAVLILGETGTGKGLLARAIHGESPRRDGPFVDINCPAIPRDLLESELFGHVKGAFTTALRDKPGLLELADGGTVLLDEVAELDPLLQVKILKFLDDGVIRRVQGTTTLKVDVRLIAATNRDIDREVEEGRFRTDLYHRLGVLILRLPALRERREDIPLLAEHFLEDLSLRLRKRALTWSPEALRALMEYAWPGNVRELINVTERLILVAKGSGPIGVEDLPAGLVPRVPLFHKAAPTAAPQVVLPPEGVPLEAVERALMVAALERTGGNVTRAAALLDLGRGSFRYRLERLGLQALASGHRGRPMGRRRRAA